MVFEDALFFLGRLLRIGHIGHPGLGHGGVTIHFKLPCDEDAVIVTIVVAVVDSVKVRVVDEGLAPALRSSNIVEDDLNTNDV